MLIAETSRSITVSDGGGGVCHLPKVFFFLKREGVSGFLTASEDSLELCLSQTGLAKNEKSDIKQPQVKK